MLSVLVPKPGLGSGVAYEMLQRIVVNDMLCNLDAPQELWSPVRGLQDPCPIPSLRLSRTPPTPSARDTR